jgi:hypothetical protein
MLGNGSPLYNSFNQGSQIKTGNPIIDQFLNSPQGLKAAADVQQLMQQANQSPQQVFMNAVQSGRFSQAEINQKIALMNMFFPGKKF